MFVRVLLIVGLIDMALARRLAPGIGMLAAVSLAICGWLFRRGRSDQKGKVESGSNPFELGEAIKFGLLFGVVTFAREGRAGLPGKRRPLPGGRRGRPHRRGRHRALDGEPRAGDHAMAGPAARAILIAVLSNTLVKTGMALFLGSPELRKRFLPSAITLLAVGALAALLVG